jgi:hypothetical protein
MTTPARILQSDIDRALKSVSAFGTNRARIVLDLRNSRIEIIVSNETAQSAATDRDDWDDSDD